VFRWLIRIIVLLLVLAAAAGATGYYWLSQPFRGFDGERMLEVVHGTSSRDIARQLADAGVVESEWMFLAARALQPGVILQAGEYRFLDAANVWQIIDRLRRGDVYTFEFTVPEGSNIWDIARLVETNGIMKERDFLAAASDPALVLDIDPAAESLEGYLFPSTYRLSRRTTAHDLVRMMVEQFKRQWKTIGGEMFPHDTVTLASLVEEETGVSSERELVAGVFTNRLRIGMQLACDPTVMYASRLLGKNRGSTIYKADLKREHPYNTYLNTGLPPGPISSPGTASLKAALHPADTDAIYFMARPDRSGHVFSATLAAHNRAVQNFRNAIAAAKASEAASQAN
jgi:UPF0755 protein